MSKKPTRHEIKEMLTASATQAHANRGAVVGVESEIKSLYRIATRAIDFPVRVARLSAAIRAKHEFVRHSNLDALTELPNKRAWGAASHREYMNAQRDGRPVLFFTFDFDKFKNVNDGYGHATGDNALKFAATKVRETLREGDMLARVGGDEFWGFAPIIVPNNIPSENRPDYIARAGVQVLEKIRLAVAEGEYAIDSHDRKKKNITPEKDKITISIGGLIYQGEEIPLKSLLSEVDAASYESKEAGRNKSTLNRLPLLQEPIRDSAETLPVKQQRRHTLTPA